jgi:hypothetical protein
MGRVDVAPDVGQALRPVIGTLYTNRHKQVKGARDGRSQLCPLNVLSACLDKG